MDSWFNNYGIWKVSNTDTHGYISDFFFFFLINGYISEILKNK